jgi:16S rRNA (uracil1498-N3)-methyltransferase
VLRVPVSSLEPGELLLDDKASRYVSRVHRLGAGERLMLFDPTSALEAEATVLSVGKAGVLCRVADVRKGKSPVARPMTLLQGIGKGDKLDAVVRDATELGATRVVAVQTARSIVRLSGDAREPDRGQERLARWRRIATEAARQCGRADVPQIDGPFNLRAALAAIHEPSRDSAAAPAVEICVFEKATTPIGPMLRALGAGTPLVVLIGPEGGLEEGEVAIAEEAGFVTASLGPFILRTETAATAVLGAALLLG